jgi:hypothetical protein
MRTTDRHSPERELDGFPAFAVIAHGEYADCRVHAGWPRRLTVTRTDTFAGDYRDDLDGPRTVSIDNRKNELPLRVTEGHAHTGGVGEDRR